MASDYILLSAIAIHAHHGANPSENDLGQRFYITVKIELDTREAARTDQVRDTINYDEVFKLVHLLQGTRGVPASRGNPEWRERGAAGGTRDDRTVVVTPLGTVGGDRERGRHLMHCGPFQLLETLGHEAALGLLARFPRASAVELTIRKPSVPIEGIVDHAEIGIRRTRADLAAEESLRRVESATVER